MIMDIQLKAEDYLKVMTYLASDDAVADDRTTKIILKSRALNQHPKGSVRYFCSSAEMATDLGLDDKPKKKASSKKKVKE